MTHFLAGIIDAKNRNRLKEENRNAAVVAYCNGDIEERFSKVCIEPPHMSFCHATAAADDDSSQVRVRE